MFRLPPELSDNTFATPAAVRVAGPGEAHIARYAPLDAVATAAALPRELRRILTLAADDIDGRGYPVWALAGVAGLPDAVAFARARRLARLGLVSLRIAYDDRDMDVVPTATGRLVAALLFHWRT